ncbi:hypothetical protein K9N68_14125 [Kovacikia minuta CCNUW1]|nr:hypothetical protein [Kovacikia minuta]UBF28872.1 hypothetical protein K9N68_14125 [Kovacikia minuta CCNUW1]
MSNHQFPIPKIKTQNSSPHPTPHTPHPIPSSPLPTPEFPTSPHIF